MNISLETILAIEFVGEEINSLVGLLEKIHNNSIAEDTSVGFKTSSLKPIEFTEDELALVNTLCASLNPEQEQEQEPVVDDISNGTNE